jgi:excisionase family DNA binding protein
MPQPLPPDATVRLLTAREVAALLAISPRKLWELTASGTVACVRIGRAVRYDPRDVEAWILRQKQRR